MSNAPNAIQVNNDYDDNMIPYFGIEFLKVEITSTSGYVPNDFLQQINTLVESHKVTGMCISVVCNQDTVFLGRQSEALHMPGFCYHLIH